VLFELAMLRLFSNSSSSDAKCVYIAPTKSLCTERTLDWKNKFGKSALGWQVVELTGDSAWGNLNSIGEARIIVTTPEKWDSMTRQWSVRRVTR
jgi:replicative superfamily II helicase